MNTLAHADTFFLVATIGFSLLFLLKSIARISTKIEKDIDTIGDTAKQFVMQLWDSTIFSWIFGKKRKRKGIE
jgi:hypothetical protein